jgi:hypothetical protein
MWTHRACAGACAGALAGQVAGRRSVIGAAPPAAAPKAARSERVSGITRAKALRRWKQAMEIPPDARQRQVLAV